MTRPLPNAHAPTKRLQRRAMGVATVALLAVGCGSSSQEAESPEHSSPSTSTQSDAGADETDATTPSLPVGDGDDGGIDAMARDAGDGEAGGMDAGAAAAEGGPPPFVATGSPITATDGAWTWVDFPDSFCRDGSTAGIAVSLQSASDKVMIYVEGGGACFDPITCLANPANVGSQKAQKTAGVFDRTNAANPVKDWNFVYIPYCTGDIGAGANPNGSVNGVTGTQKFVGYLNMKAFLNRVAPTFPSATHVLLTGVSAGGFGAAADALLVQRAFPSVKLALVDDSGPPMSSTYLPTCLQDEWRTTWGFEDSFLKDCGSACPNHSDYILDYAKFLGNTYSNRMAGLIESSDDGVISAFYGYGQNNCTGSLLTPISATNYSAALVEFRGVIAGVDPNFGTYYPSGMQHTWLGDNSLYTETMGGTMLVDWFTKIVNDTSVSQVGP